MWGSSSSSKSSSSSSDSPSLFSHYRRTSNKAAEGASQNGGLAKPRPAKGAFDIEDAWKLDDDEEEDDEPGSSDIAKVAAQAGLGRKASSGELSLAAPAPTKPPPTSLHSSSASSSTLSLHSSKSQASSAAIKSPPAQAKERGRQASYGFWERISGFGVGGSSSKAREIDDDGAVAEGYSRFDDQLALEDNFDGTFSVASSASAAASNPNKLMAAANISRPPLIGGGSAAARSSSKVPQVASPTASSTKGKGRSLDSPGAVTVVGTPRPRSPFVHGAKGDKPRDTDDMRRAVRKDLEDVMKDPVNLLKHLSLGNESTTPATPNHAASLPTVADYYSTIESPEVAAAASFPYDSHLADQSIDAALSATELAKAQAQTRRDTSRKEKFVECLRKDTVDIAELRKLAWAGIPAEVRPIAWQLLLGYLPAVSSRRVSALARKRQEYADAVSMAFSRGESSLDAALWHQIKIDVPRTNPGVPLWQFDSTQRSLEKILYVWAIRHPASGYVQGINDLATPFFQVFLSAYIDCNPEFYDISALPGDALSAVEADTFWCLSKLLDGIQDNYIFAQPGIHRQVARCQELCLRVDAPLAKHLDKEGVTFLQFSFRWFHLLFLRVLPVNAVIRMWDTYMSEGSDAFANFHTYVCLAFLLRWSEKLRSMDFQAIMLFLQDPVDHDAWTESMTELLLSEAYMWSALWSGSRNTK